MAAPTARRGSGVCGYVRGLGGNRISQHYRSWVLKFDFLWGVAAQRTVAGTGSSKLLAVVSGVSADSPRY